jgi:hypothetical protein
MIRPNIRFIGQLLIHPAHQILAGENKMPHSEIARNNGYAAKELWGE